MVEVFRTNRLDTGEALDPDKLVHSWGSKWMDESL